MNRQQRRAQAAQRQNREAWSHGIRQVHEDAAGLLELFIVLPPEMPGLLAAMGSSGRLTKLAALAMRTIMDLHEAPANDPLQCLACCRPMTLRIPCSVVLAIPQQDAPRKCLGSVMCADCGTEPDVIQTKAIQALKNVWPQLRPITVSDQVGHA